MKILVVLALTFALVPTWLPWVAGGIVAFYLGDFVIDAAHTHYLRWAADREYRKLSRK